VAGGVEVAETERDVVGTSAGTTPARAESRWGVLRHRHYRNVWLGAFTSNVGGWMEATGIQWVMTTETLREDWKSRGLPSAVVMLSYLAVAQMAPMLLLSLPGGLVADRIDRKKLLLVTQLILMSTAAALTTLSFLKLLSPWSLMAIAAINGITMAFNIPAWQVLTPRLVPREDLTKAITLNGIAFNLARVVGPALGGVLMGWRGPSVLFFCNSMSFLAVIVAVIGTPPAPAPAKDGTNAWERTREAASFVFHNRGPFLVFLAMVLFSMLATPLMRMLPVFVAEVYHAEEKMFGTMLSLMGLGAVIGGFSVKLVPSWYPKHHFIPLSVFFGGVAVAGWAVISNVWLAGAAIFVCGVFWMWAFNTTAAAIQLLVDDRMRGRVLSVCNTAVFGAMPLGAYAAAHIGQALAPGSSEGLAAQRGVAVMGAALAVIGLVMLIWRTPEIDDLKPGDPGYDRKPGLIRGITGSAHKPRTPAPVAEDTGAVL
jgi:MFS family permease